MNLTTALAIAAGVVLAGVGVQGFMASRRAGPKRAVVQAAAPAAGERVEPPLEGDTVPTEDAVAAAAPEVRPALPRRAPRLDALIDAIVPLALEAPVAAEGVLAHLPASRRAGTKPFYVEGLEVDSGEWEPLAAGRRYGELQAGVQMAARNGALNEIEYSEFVQKVEAFAEAVGAMPDFPDMLDVVARARELDGLAGPLDMQLSVTLRSNGVAWSVGYLQQIAARHGFVPGAVPGRLVLPALEDGAPPVLVLAFDPQAALAEDPQQSAVRECQLTLDVPQTPESAEPFPAWHRVATALADDMDAAAVDDQGQPVTLHAFAAIGREVESLYRRLEQLDLAAGSPAARRLFA
ncbi:MAG: cell division protein FtsZ [Rubrivivax sp.]